MGRAWNPGVRARAVRRRAQHRHRTGGHGHRSASSESPALVSPHSSRGLLRFRDDGRPQLPARARVGALRAERPRVGCRAHAVSVPCGRIGRRQAVRLDHARRPARCDRPDVRDDGRQLALQRRIRPGRPGALRQAAGSGRRRIERARVADEQADGVRPQGARVSLHAAVLAARHDGPGVGARAGAAVRGVRADVDPAVRADGIPEARRRGA